MEFLAISYHLPANPSRYRVATWKKLKVLGAVYLQPGVAVLPINEENKQAFEALGKDVRSWSGNASVLVVSFSDPQDESAMLHAFSAARTEEYQVIASDSGRLMAQLRWEKENGSFDEARYQLELKRLARRLDEAIQHDFFSAEGREEAEAALKALQAELPVQAQKKATSKSKPTSHKKPATHGAPRKATLPTEKRQEPVQAPQPAEIVEMEKEKEEDQPTQREMPVFLF